MADVIAFSCVRPQQNIASEVAALPYDVYSLEEAREEIKEHPLSFLRIDSAEATILHSVPKNDESIYAKAKAQLDEAIEDGTFLVDEEACYYLYRITAPDGRAQTGVIGCASISDYLDDTIKKHEKTKPDKEVDRIRHVDTCSAHSGPIFLAFRSDGTIEEVMAEVTAGDPLYDFTAPDGVGHTVWRVGDAARLATIRETFDRTPALYIADGHHRAKSAVEVGLLRREAAKNGGAAVEDAPGMPASEHFLSIIFPSNQLAILDYNRVVKGLNGHTLNELLEHLKECFEVSKPQAAPVKPDQKGTFGMYVEGAWYKLKIKDAFTSNDPVNGLDASILQERVLAPLLGIEDPRTNDRIDFIGGIRGLAELERRVKSDMTIAFALYPTSIEELFAVADAGKLMPPKSTWFEPKPRSGLFIHRI